MSAICDAHKKKVVVEQSYNPGEDRKSVSWRSDQLERRCWNEEHVPERLVPQAPRLSSREERERNSVVAIRVGGQYFAVLFSLQIPFTHNLFNKVRGIFFERTVSLVYIVSSLWFCIHVYVLCGYTTCPIWSNMFKRENAAKINIFPENLHILPNVCLTFMKQNKVFPCYNYCFSISVKAREPHEKCLAWAGVKMNHLKESCCAKNKDA